MRKIISLAFALLIFSNYYSLADKPDTNIRINSMKYGFYGSVNSNMAEGDARQSLDFVDSVPRYCSGDNLGYSFVGFFEFPVSEKSSIIIRAIYSHSNSTMTGLFPTGANLNGKDTIAQIGHTFTSNLSNISLEPIFKFRFIGNVFLMFGVNAGFRLQGSYSHKEVVQNSTDGIFPNGTNTLEKTVTENSINNKYNLAMILGVGYEIKLDKREKYFLTPELLLSYGYYQVTNNFTWDVNTVRFGVSLKFSPGNQKYFPPEIKHESKKNIITKKIERDDITQLEVKEGLPLITLDTVATEDLITITETTNRTDTAFIPIQKPLPVKDSVMVLLKNEDSISFSHVGLKGKKEIGLDTIKIEEYPLSNSQPLLNYIFFDDNSYIIPDRYVMLNSETASIFKSSSMNFQPTLKVYYNLMNLIGSRMQKDDKGKITLIGCNSDVGNEKGNTALSRKRAEAVKDYLTSVWQINPDRISIKENNLPEKPSSSNDSDGVAENRRVEIITDTPNILSPIVTNDVFFKLIPNAIRIKIKSNLDDTTVYWKLLLLLNSDTLTTASRNETLPQKLDFDLNEFNKLLTVNNADFKYFIEVKHDSINKIYERNSSIPVKRVVMKSQKKIERFRLILFDFNKYELNEANKRIIDFINKKINSKSKVIVEGYTDRVGSKDYNLQLSEARAKAVSDAIHCEDKTFKGIGESTLYDNKYPEGRFFCRTVEIRIEEK